MLYYSEDAQKSLENLFYYPCTFGKNLQKALEDMKMIRGVLNALPLSPTRVMVRRFIRNIGTITYISSPSSCFIDRRTAKLHDRSMAFKKAARNAFNQQNGYGLRNVPYGDADDTNLTYTKDSVYGTHGEMFNPRMTDHFCTISGLNDGSKIYSNQDVTTTNFGVKPDWKTKSKRGEIDDLDSQVNASTYNPMLKMAQMKGDKQVRDYFQGKSKYKNGHGDKIRNGFIKEANICFCKFCDNKCIIAKILLKP